MGSQDASIAVMIGETAAAVVAALQQEPRLVVTDRVLVDRFGLKAKMIDQLLWPAIELGALQRRREGHDIVYRLGDTALAQRAAAAEPAAAPAAPAAVPSAAATLQRQARCAKRLPPLDIGSIGPVRRDVPLPTTFSGRKGATIYAEILDSLTEPGMSRDGIPIEYRGALGKAAITTGKANGRAYAMRITSPTTCGIWRTK